MSSSISLTSQQFIEEHILLHNIHGFNADSTYETKALFGIVVLPLCFKSTTAKVFSTH